MLPEFPTKLYDLDVGNTNWGLNPGRSAQSRWAAWSIAQQVHRTKLRHFGVEIESR
jgi:hypothetical protein